MTEPLFVHDGYTADGYVEKASGIHAALRFRYRPATVVEKTSITQRIQAHYRKQETADAEALAAKFMSEKIISWSAGVKNSPENMLGMQPTLQAKVFDIIMGQRASDVDPDAEAAPANHEADAKN